MCDDYSYFRRGELHKSAMMTERPVLLPIETRRKCDLREYQVAAVQTSFFYLTSRAQTLWFLIKCIHYDLPRVREQSAQI